MAVILAAFESIPSVGLAAGPPATIAAWTGTPQSAATNTDFGVLMVAVVRDTSTNGVQGVTVTFTAPGSGASGTFNGSTSAGVVTDNNGLAIAPRLRANGVSGTYTVTATVPGVGSSAAYIMTNTGGGSGTPGMPAAPTNVHIVSIIAGGPPVSIAATSGAAQSAAVNTVFATPLGATVRDASSNPVSGVTVTFTAPASGASARFSGSAVATAVSDSSGVATAPALTANGTLGSYTVAASVSSVPTPATFSLTNASTGPGGGGVNMSWTNVTPAGISLDPNGTIAGAGQNFGVQGVTADPARPGTLYTPVTYQGLWKSTDYGQTWSRVTVTSGPDPIANGRAQIDIAPDGSYMIAISLYPINGVTNGSWKSLNGGQTWTRYNTGADGEDVMQIMINPFDKSRVLVAAHHAPFRVYESRDAGQTYTDLGDVGGAVAPVFVWLDSDTVMAVGDGDNNPAGAGSWRGVRSRSTWPWTWTWTRVSTQQHWHGSTQIFIDPTSGAVFMGGGFGIQKSTDNGVSWTTVSSTYSAGIVGTATKLYSTSNYASLAGFGPNLMIADRAAGGTAWTNATGPAAMNNGWIHAAVVHDGSRYIIVSGNWLAGIWRHVEP
jgi:hypothetical protein